MEVLIKKKEIIKIGIFFLILFITGCKEENKIGTVTKGDYSKAFGIISSKIQQKIDSAYNAGLSIAIVDGNKTIYSKGFGFTDGTNKLMADSQTCYKIGSISKLFTATAIMQLAEQNKIDLDKPLNYYIPEFKIKSRFGDTDKITVSSLMTHHSGLPCDNLKGMWSDTPQYFDSMINYLSNQYAAYPPQYVFAYSNIAIDLLGIIVERISGSKFSEYIDKHLLTKLNMNFSSFELNEKIRSKLSKNFRDDKWKYELLMRDTPAGGMYSNVNDMAEFIKFIINDSIFQERGILQKATIERMFAKQNRDIPLDFNFDIGLNWMLTKKELEYAGKVYWHNGGTIDFFSSMIILPDQKLGVIILSNSEKLAGFTNKFAVESMQLLVKAKSGLEPEKPEYKRIISDKFTDDEILFYSGDYITNFGFLSIKSDVNDNLIAEISDIKFNLQKNEGGYLSVKYRLFGLIPLNVMIPKGLYFSVKKVGDEKIITLYHKKLETPIGVEHKIKQLSKKWKNRIGDYKIVSSENDAGDEISRMFMLGNFSKTAKIRVNENGLLYVELVYSSFNNSNPKYFLEPVSDNEAIILGIGRNMRETVFFNESKTKTFIDCIGMKFEKNNLFVK